MAASLPDNSQGQCMSPGKLLDLDAAAARLPGGPEMLYEMATGQQAFTGSTSAVIFDSILHKAPTSPVRLNPDLPEDLERIINKTLEKDRELRYQSASELRADLKRLRRESDSGRTAVVAEAPVREKHSRKWVIYPVLAAVLIAIIVTVISFFSNRGEPINSIAVLPFVSTSEDPEAEILSEGITEDLINSLTQLSDLQVAPRSRVFKFKNMEYDEQKIAEDLNVRAILMGKIDDVSIQVDLVDADSSYQLWGWRYNLKSSTLPIIREDIQKNVAKKLRLQLTEKDQELLAKRYTENPEALRLYTLGRHHMNKRTQGDFQKAINYFNQAIDEDPGYALAYSGLADCYDLSATWGWVAPKERLPPAKDAAQKSINLDPELAEGHASLGLVACELEWDWQTAEREYKRAIDLNPAYANVRHWYGDYLILISHYEEAITQKNLAIKLEPLVPYFQTSAGIPYYLRRQYDEAIDQFQKAVNLEPNFHAAHFLLGQAYLGKNMYEDAIQEIEEAIKFSGPSPQYLGTLSYAYSLAGRKSDALKVLEELKELEKNRFISSIGFIYSYIGLGDHEKAIQYLQKSYESHDTPSLPSFIKEKIFDDIRSDPRFQEIVRNMNIPENSQAQP